MVKIKRARTTFQNISFLLISEKHLHPVLNITFYIDKINFLWKFYVNYSNFSKIKYIKLVIIKMENMLIVIYN